jgi:hypothetical protein
MAHPDHDHDHPCRCMFRLFEVAGELHVRQSPTSPKTPTPQPLPFTGFHLRMTGPETVIISDLLADVLPAGYEGDLLLLDPESSAEIPLDEGDFEEIADMFLSGDRPAGTAPARSFVHR